jgi:hypothetical protein
MYLKTITETEESWTILLLKPYVLKLCMSRKYHEWEKGLVLVQVDKLYTLFVTVEPYSCESEYNPVSNLLVVFELSSSHTYDSFFDLDGL